MLTLNQQVRLRSDPRGLVFTVVSLFLEGDEHWCALQVGDAKSSKGARIHRPVAEVVTLAELAGEVIP